MLKIVFFGTPRFSAVVLDYLLSKKVQVIAVVTKPDRPRGRSGTPQPSSVKELAIQKKIPVYQPLKASAPDFVEFLKSLYADLFVVVAYSEIFKENLLQTPLLGCINVHASLLPKYRGAAPIQRCIMEGEKESGVTIMSMAKELDAGDILSIVKTPLSDQMTAGELSNILSHLGAQALWEVIQKYEKGEIQPLPQNASQATYAPKLTSEDGEIHWERSAFILHCQIRGVTPKPGAWCWIMIRGERKRLLIKKTKIEAGHSAPPGTLIAAEGLIIACGTGALRLLEIQLEGKKNMTAEEFLRGISKKELYLKF